MAMKTFTGFMIISVPVTATILDIFGYVAKVEGISMQPSLNPKEEHSLDYVFLNRWKAKLDHFERGEVISLISPSQPEQRLIKRIVALEGDTVKTLSYKNRYVTIPPGYCWIEGDHHGKSHDSNFFGPIPIGLITAKASHIVWPPRRWKPLEKIESRRVKQSSRGFFNTELF